MTYASVAMTRVAKRKVSVSLSNLGTHCVSHTASDCVLDVNALPNFGSYGTTDSVESSPCCELFEINIVPNSVIAFAFVDTIGGTAE